MAITQRKTWIISLELALEMIVSVIDQSEKLNHQGHLLKTPKYSHTSTRTSGIVH